MANYITQEEFTQQHPATDLSQYTASTVSGMISEASAYVDNFCQVDGFDLQSVTGEKSEVVITNQGDLQVHPRRFPLLSISAIDLKRGTFSLALTLTSGATSLVEIPTSRRYAVYPNTYLTSVGTFTINDLRAVRPYDVFAEVDYLGGYQTIPGPIKVATMLIFRDLVNKRLNVVGASQITQGGITIKYAEKTDGKSDDVRDAETLLAPYVRTV